MENNQGFTQLKIFQRLFTPWEIMKETHQIEHDDVSLKQNLFCLVLWEYLDC